MLQLGLCVCAYKGRESVFRQHRLWIGINHNSEDISLNNTIKVIVALAIGAFFGSAIGWISCYYVNWADHANADLSERVAKIEAQSVLASAPSKEVPRVIRARGIEIIGDDGSLCMQIVASSGTPTDGTRNTESVIYFYGPDGNVSHVLGRLGDGFVIFSEDKNMNRLWGIEEPSTRIFSENHK